MGNFCWVSGFLRQIENGNAVSDTPGGLRPTGGGKPGGLGCGCKKINKKTQQFIAGDLLQFHWMLMKVFAKRDLYGGPLNLLLRKESIPIVNVSGGKKRKSWRAKYFLEDLGP